MAKETQKRQNGKAVFIRIDDELKAKIEKLAKKDSRKVTDWIRLQLIKIAK